MTKLTKEQVTWFCERLKESPTGKVIVSSSLVNKYRKLTADYDSPNAIIRSRIIDLDRWY